jgi:ribosomal protein S18 acetylase RimI-like enzyme
MVHWAETVWAKGKSDISTYVFDFDAKKMQKLLGLGYVNVRHENNVRYYDLTDYDFSYTLKPGFKIMPFNQFGDYDKRIATTKNAFSIKEYPKARLVSLQSSPQYIPELDLVVASPEGECAAYCMGWVEEHDDTLGYIEPMGTHSGYRRMGFASSLAKECFKRLAALGVKTATIASHAEPNISNFLYESLKPVRKKKGFEFKKQMKPSKPE